MVPAPQVISLDQAIALYPEIKALLPLASAEWSESYNLGSSTAEICIPNRFTGEIEPIAHILSDCPYDDRRLMLKAPLYMNALWVLLQEAFRRIPQESTTPEPPRATRSTVSQACGMMCNDADFLDFLAICEGVDTADRERVANRVGTMLDIGSRAELDTNEAARKRWFNLCDRFRAWMKQQGRQSRRRA